MISETLIIPDITKTESNNCFIIHCFEENNDKRIIAAITVYFQTLKNVQLSDNNQSLCQVFQSQSQARTWQIVIATKLGTLFNKASTTKRTTTIPNRGRLAQGFRFRRGKRSLSSAGSQTDDDFFFAKNFVLLQSC